MLLNHRVEKNERFSWLPCERLAHRGVPTPAGTNVCFGGEENTWRILVNIVR